MIEIRDIAKTYTTGDLVQRALDGGSVTFRDNEFVAVLGPFRLRQDHLSEHLGRIRPRRLR